MKSSIILASSTNDCIGVDNALPWCLPADLKRFEHITSANKNSVVVMGKKTYESMGKPLPGRINYVLTTNYKAAKKISANKFTSIDDVIEDIMWWENFTGCEFHVFFIGGARIFEEAIKHEKVNTIYHTLIHADIEGDTFFKVPDWDVVESKILMPNSKNKYKLTFRKMIRPSI